MVTLFCILCTNVFADVNFGNDDGANFGEGNGNNFWGLKYPNGSKLYETEGLRITVYSAEDNTKVASTFDISGIGNAIDSVGDIYNFTNSTGELISKTEWLEYVGKTYNALDESSVKKFNTAIFNRYNDGAIKYQTKHVPELNSIDIISENNTQNLEKIKALISSEAFITRMCELIGGDITYDDFQKGKYKIAFEPVAYFCYGGYNFAMTATECGLWNKYLKNTLSASWNSTNNLRALLGPLTHSILPRSAFLEKEDLDIATYQAKSSDWYNGNSNYNNDNCIIRCMGIGILNALGNGGDEQENGGGIMHTISEYHTDTNVYTSFYFINDSSEDIIASGNFSIYNSKGETPAKNTAPTSEKDEDGVYEDNTIDTLYKESTEKVSVYIENPAYAEALSQGKNWGVKPYKKLGTYADGDWISLNSNDIYYTVKGKNGSLIAEGTLSFSCPSHEEAMAWFDWKTPKTAQDVSITIQSNKDGVYILDENGSSRSAITIKASVTNVTENTPPDPTATDKKLNSFKLLNETTILKNISQYAPLDNEQTLTWYVWTYDWYQNLWWANNTSSFYYYNNEGEKEKDTYYTEYYGVNNNYYPRETSEEKTKTYKYSGAVILGGNAHKTEYSVTLSADISVTPSKHVPTAIKNNALNTYTMKSGYGFNIEINAHISGDTTLCTGSQKANVLFPEFNYTTYNRLLEKSGKTFVFKENQFSTYNDRVHFTPIWFPDDDYIVYAEVFDVWCPAGQLSVRLTSDQISISGNVYDDWHVAPDKP